MFRHLARLRSRDISKAPAAAALPNRSGRSVEAELGTQIYTNRIFKPIWNLSKRTSQSPHQPGDCCALGDARGGHKRGSEISGEEDIKRRGSFRGLKETLKAAAQEQKCFKLSSHLIHKDVLMPLILCLLRK